MSKTVFAQVDKRVNVTDFEAKVGILDKSAVGDKVFLYPTVLLLEIFSEKLEKSEKIKNEILFFQKNQEEISFSQIIDIYDNYIKEIDDITNIVLLQKYKFQFSNKF